ncbi:MAG: 2-hydroxyacyl-CoA dehydratase [Verrucomicrobia bacterium]|nr:2-hydroxyacyl-CoA dehydratase [Verrucomicrobiota bacterium]
MTTQTAAAPERKDLQTTKLMRTVMGNYFMELENGPKQGKKTAWCTSVGPAELLHALGYNVYFPENHGAMLGATRMATDVIPLANAKGFSPDICSYLTSDIGAYLKNDTPLKKVGMSGVPKADVLVFNTNQCRDVKDWFQFYAREWNVPCIGIHTARSLGDLDEPIIEDVARQTEALVPTLEKVAGQKLDMDKFKEIVGLSRRCTDLWKGVLEAATAVPAPITFFDGTIQMGPAVVLRGTQSAIQYYEALLAELKQRVAEKVPAVPGEQFRIYWDGMPVWGKLRDLSTQFMNLKTAVVASTYCNSWIFEDLDPADPWRSMARAYCRLFICRSEDAKEAYMEQMARKYKVNGIIYHDSKTCPNNSNNRYQMPERLDAKLGIPHLVIHGDLNDLRLYSEEQAKTNIQAFVEGFAQR